MFRSMLLLLVVVVVVASAVHCPEDICARVRCKRVDSCPEGQRVKKNAGSCGCCDDCVTILYEGESCSHPVKGDRITEECDTGLLCHEETLTCISP